MSSVVGWLAKSPQSLSKLRDSFSAMRKELPLELHEGKFGSQFSIFFEVEQGDEITLSPSVQLPVAPILRFRTFAHRPFVEVKIQIFPGQDFHKVFDDLGLAQFVSRSVLAEQTSADSSDDINTEPGFEVVGPLAFAACGGVTWAVEESSVKERIAKVADQHNMKSDVAKLACWFNEILDHNQGADRYKKLLEHTPTYLFSILFDSRSDNLHMVGLRQNERENGDNSPYEHLFYAENDKIVAMARTAAAVQEIVANPLPPSLVADGQPKSLVLPA